MKLKFASCALLFLITLFIGNFTFSQEKLSFIVFGDWGRNGSFNQSENASQMGAWGEKYNISFIISTGDNFYPDGALSVDSPQWLTSFENIYTAPSLQKKWYVVLGNYDYHISPLPEIEYTKTSSRWYLPERYYSQTIKIDNTTAALFIFMDTTPFVKEYYTEDHSDAPMQDVNKQLAWIDSTLSSSNVQWKFVTGHHPVYTGGEHGNTVELVEQLKPVMEKHKVNAYFCGHDHDLQHLRIPGESVNYFVSGAGSKTRSCKDTEYTLFQKGGLTGFLVVSLSTTEMQAVFIDYVGNEIYKTAINK
jgi:tartrate-resistant acid phosphatase type 5